MISTIIPVLNGQKWIAKAIDSFLIQTTPAELIIVDGSKDNLTEEEVKKYRDHRIRYYHRPDLEGIFDKCNFGLDMATGDIFHTMACDHRLMPGTYELVEKEIKDVEWVFGKTVLVNENEVEIVRSGFAPFNLMEYRKNNILAGCTAYVKKEFVLKHGLRFNQKYPLSGDYDFYLRLAHLSQPKHLNEFMIKLVIRKDGLCDFGNNEEMLNKHRAEIIENIQKEFPLPDYLEGKKPTKPRVLIAACNLGWLRVEVANALIRLTHDQRVDLKIMYPATRPYENSLSLMANKVKKEKWDYLLIIDDDNPPTKNPLDLVFLGLDIVACPTPQWNDIDQFPIYYVAMDRVENGYQMHKKMEGLQEVDAVGTGCVLISRKVLEQLEAPFTRIWNKDGTMETGVDFHFCEQAKEKGFKVYAHYDYLCDHFKELSLLKVLEFKNTN